MTDYKGYDIDRLSESINNKADRDLSNTTLNSKLDEFFSEFDLLWSGWQNSASWVTLPLSKPYTNYKFLVIMYGTGTTTNHDICQTVLFVPALRFLSSSTTDISDYGNFCYGYDQIYVRVMVDDNENQIKIWTNGTGVKYIYGIM
jgi:hypothetical protein